MDESTPRADFSPDARFTRLETALYERLIDTYRHPFTESKGRVRKNLMDVIWAGRSSEANDLGREPFNTMMDEQCEAHVQWEHEMQGTDERIAQAHAAEMLEWIEQNRSQHGQHRQAAAG